MLKEKELEKKECELKQMKKIFDEEWRVNAKNRSRQLQKGVQMGKRRMNDEKKTADEGRES